jgi:hypothetical protein
MKSEGKILIFSDSLALARSSPEKVVHEQTWPSLLRDKFPVHQVSIGGGTVVDLVRQATYHQSYDPDIVVLQFGIVDCAPRFLTKFEIEIIRRIPFFGKRIMKSMNNQTIRRLRKISYVSYNSFVHHARLLQKLFPAKYFVVLGIIPATKEYELLLPGVTGSIKRYNEGLMAVFGSQFISMDGFPASGLMSDYHHINPLGHRYIFDLLLTRLARND